jgi:hypothetical protein
MNLIQLVPRLPPRIDGIGDYSLVLAESLRHKYELETTFVVGDPEYDGPEELNGFRVLSVKARDHNSLYNALAKARAAASEPSKLLVQFAPYGYQIRGYPRWILKALERWSIEFPDTLHVMYHELETKHRYPWSSAFWVPPLQRALIQKLGQLSSFRFTNTDPHQRKLESSGTGDVILIPNFSTVGEPQNNTLQINRLKQIIIFGRSWQRQLSYREGKKSLRRVCEIIGAETVVDIGDPISGDTRSEIDGIPIVRYGRLDGREVSCLMDISIATFLYYPVDQLTKSSVFASSCAHGTIPFVLDDHSKCDMSKMLSENQDVVLVSTDGWNSRIPDLQQLSNSVFNRYRARSSIAAAAKLFQKFAQI